MDKIMGKILFVFLILNGAGDLHGHDLFSGARIKGRGNTYTAQYLGDHSPRFNPATLAESNYYFQLRPLELTTIVGENVVNTVSDLVNHDFSSNNSDTVIEFIRKFHDKFGDRHYGSLEAEILSFRILQFEFMPFLTNKTFIEIRRPTIPQFDFSLDTLAGINMAYGHTFGGKFHVGMAIRPTFRTTTNGQLTFTDILDLENTDVDEISDTDTGIGVGVDLGGIWHPSVNWRLAATIQNLGGMGYLSGDDTPEVLRQVTNLGVLYRKPVYGWDLNLLADFQGIENAEGIHWSRLLHLGTEIGKILFTNDLDFGLTTGINDGYFSYGMFIDAWLMRFEISKYWDELDTNPGMRGDERIAFSLRTSMSF